jgi:DNA (cytosine-5)-methyltransferase 1
LTPSTGECPREENASTLSQILQVGVPERYCLSQKACLGILQRASARGKELPPLLAGALNAAAGTKQQTYILQGAMIGWSEKNGPQGSGVNKDVSFTLDATDRHAVAYGKDRLYTASKTSFFMSAHEKVADTLVATDYKDPPLINDKDGADYIVRRLTPTECARLQGFPDWWCNDLGTEKPTDEEMYFWYQVFETYRDVTNPGGKMKTSNQIRKWLQNPASDSAEYKMWGNGVALPCVVFVLSGIVYYAQKSGS